MCLFQAFSQLFSTGPAFIPLQPEVGKPTEKKQIQRGHRSQHWNKNTNLVTLLYPTSYLCAKGARPRDLLPIPKIYLLTEGTQQGLFTAHSRSGLLKFSFSSKNSDVYPYLQEVKFPRPASPLSQVFLIALTSAT